MDDLTAVRRLKNGDISGLEALVRRYQVEAMRTAYLITQDTALADDVMQEAFLRVYRHIDSFDEGRAFKPWFMRVVANAAVKAVASDREVLSLDAVQPEYTFEAVFTDSAPSPEQAYEMTELKRLVWETLSELPPEQRAVLVLRYYHDFSEREMAETLAIPPGTVGWRLHAARKRLGGLLRRKSAEWQEG